MQALPEQKAGIVSTAETFIVFVKVKVELAGVTKLAVNFQKLKASCGAPYVAPASILPT